MPICDGVEAAKRIRLLEKERNTSILPSTVFSHNNLFPVLRKGAVVALSADCQDSTKQLCLSAGMDAFFSKPLKKGTYKFFASRLIN
jgi:CheY-like chemotaxis protein